MTIQDQLYDKVTAEYAARLDEIRQLDPDQIINKAHEIDIKADLLMCFEAREIEGEYARALVACDKPLDCIYRQWFEADSSRHMDALQVCIERQAKELLEEVGRGYEILERAEEIEITI
ncbi:MAG: DUF3848 domain-containing protein [Oscillospiraceae bacterium]|nr:DUF3848 domain-containing protein [Oscillospiraceae bacterium]